MEKSPMWDDEPVLQAALIRAGDAGDCATIREITNKLAALHPDRQRKTTDYGIFLPLDEVDA